MSPGPSLHELFESGGRECTLGHEGVLTLARKVQAAAQDADADRLADATGRFAEGLACHVLAETPAFVALAPPEARIIEPGSARLVALTEALLDDAERGGTQVSPTSAQRADEIVALLTLQIDDERKVERGMPS